MEHDKSCQLCNDDLAGDAEGTIFLTCAHSFHRSCVDEYKMVLSLPQGHMLVCPKCKLGTEVAPGEPSRPVVDLGDQEEDCLLYTSPSPRDGLLSRMPSSA